MGDNMKKVFSVVKKIIFSAFLIYGYNLIAVNFNMLIPINIYNISIVTFLGAPGMLALVLFKYVIR
jgi:pro-sigmaK processing inhibitor BofA